MRIWGITDTGMVRKENQDAYAIQDIAGYTVAIVCDGMGGTSGGRLASTIAVDTYREELTGNLKEGMSPDQLEQVSRFAASLANTAIREEAARTPGYERMGTTLVSAIALDDRALISNVGDSRAYLIDREGLRQISRDHSVVENMVERGDLTPLAARHHPSRNLITRALGPDPKVETDTFPITWKQGDFILLCSDGLVNTVTDQEILFEVIHGGAPDGCLERLLALAKQRGAPDNVTVVLLMNI